MFMSRSTASPSRGSRTASTSSGTVSATLIRSGASSPTRAPPCVWFMCLFVCWCWCFSPQRSKKVASIDHQVVPPLPDKKLNFKIGKMGTDTEDPEFLAKRQAGLQSFIQRVLRHPTLGSLPAVVDFVTVIRCYCCRADQTIVYSLLPAPFMLHAAEGKLAREPHDCH